MSKNQTTKRTDYLSWDQFFMGVAHICALRSKDPNTQVGACVVNNLNQIIASGYNGLPRGLDDDAYPWGRTGTFLETKYAYVAHAELNAIVSAKYDLAGSRIYVSLFPCHECVKIIIQANIKEVIYDNDKYAGTDDNIAAKRMLTDAGISFRLIPKVKVAITCE